MEGLDFKWDLKYGSPIIHKLTKTAATLYLPFEIQTILPGFPKVGTSILDAILDFYHLKADLQSLVSIGQFSDPHCIKKTISIPDQKCPNQFYLTLNYVHSSSKLRAVQLTPKTKKKYYHNGEH